MLKDTKRAKRTTTNEERKGWSWERRAQDPGRVLDRLCAQASGRDARTALALAKRAEVLA